MSELIIQTASPEVVEYPATGLRVWIDNQELSGDDQADLGVETVSDDHGHPAILFPNPFELFEQLAEMRSSFAALVDVIGSEQARIPHDYDWSRIDNMHVVKQPVIQRLGEAGRGMGRVVFDETGEVVSEDQSVTIFEFSLWPQGAAPIAHADGTPSSVAEIAAELGEEVTERGI